MNKRPLRILYLEDTHPASRDTSSILNQAGYEVHHANINDDILSKFTYHTWFNLVIIDNLLPSQDVITTLNTLQVIDETIPVLVQSNNSSQELKLIKKHSNVVATLHRPVDAPNLLRLVRAQEKIIKHNTKSSISKNIDKLIAEVNEIDINSISINESTTKL